MREGTGRFRVCPPRPANERADEEQEAGSNIFGNMFLACTPGSPRCSRFTVNALDQTTNQSTELKQTSSFGLYFNWAFAASLEVYNVSECSDYPADENDSTQFYFLGLYDQDVQPVKQGWVPWKRSTQRLAIDVTASKR